LNVYGYNGILKLSLINKRIIDSKLLKQVSKYISLEEELDFMTFNLKYDQERIRKYHYFLLLSLIQKYKSISRSQLAKLTKMSNTTVGKIIRELIEDGLVNEVGQTVGDVGRRATLLEINPQGAYIVGVEIDLDKTQIGIVTLDGK